MLNTMININVSTSYTLSYLGCIYISRITKQKSKISPRFAKCKDVYIVKSAFVLQSIYSMKFAASYPIP